MARKKFSTDELTNVIAFWVSRAEELLTAALKQALAMVDCKVLDHFVVAGEKTTSSLSVVWPNS
jgi:hypothetical protein